jgi:hypothetical protein
MGGSAIGKYCGNCRENIKAKSSSRGKPNTLFNLNIKISKERNVNMWA